MAQGFGTILNDIAGAIGMSRAPSISSQENDAVDSDDDQVPFYGDPSMAIAFAESDVPSPTDDETGKHAQKLCPLSGLSKVTVKCVGVDCLCV